MIDSVDHILEKFEISHYGFLPVDEPLARLPSAYYEPWESLISRLPTLIKTQQLYSEIDKLPVLNTSNLGDIAEWRRAYVVLTFFTHAHIWTDPNPHDILPPSITIPLLEISERLGLPPTATYPALNLWNCGLVAEGADITKPENVIMRHTFTGTSDEAWFYAVSVSVEAKGMEAIRLALECVAAIDQGDETTTLRCIGDFAAVVEELGAILHRMHERCEPDVFYHQIRPYLAGSKGMEKAGLPKGIFYDEGHGKGSWRQYNGGSNAQSTLIQFLDIALGVEHRLNGSSEKESTRETYLDEMRKYMPRSHRQFLAHFSRISNIRESLQASSSPAMSSAFNKAVDSMTAFRNIHLQIVARYVIKPARSGTTKDQSGTKNIAAASTATSTKAELKGTGGTDLMAFLKGTRDETKVARVPIIALS